MTQDADLSVFCAPLPSSPRESWCHRPVLHPSKLILEDSLEEEGLGQSRSPAGRARAFSRASGRRPSSRQARSSAEREWALWPPPRRAARGVTLAVAGAGRQGGWAGACPLPCPSCLISRAWDRMFSLDGVAISAVLSPGSRWEEQASRCRFLCKFPYVPLSILFKETGESVLFSLPVFLLGLGRSSSS